MTTDEILTKLSARVAEGKYLPKDDWLRVAFDLNVLYLGEIEALESQRQEVAIKKLSLLKSQEKRNVAAVNLEIEASEEYKKMRIQEAKVEQIKEFIRIAKRNTDNL